MVIRPWRSPVSFEARISGVCPFYTRSGFATSRMTRIPQTREEWWHGNPRGRERAISVVTSQDRVVFMAADWPGTRISYKMRKGDIMRTRKRVFFRVSLVCTVVSLAACTLKLEDKSAPSFEFSLEADYDVTRWGGEEKSGRAATPPERKWGDADHSGTAFRIRGQFSHTFTWYDRYEINLSGPYGAIGLRF